MSSANELAEQIQAMETERDERRALLRQTVNEGTLEQNVALGVIALHEILTVLTDMRGLLGVTAERTGGSSQIMMPGGRAH